MNRSEHIHTPNDGRGFREVFLNGKKITKVVRANTKKGTVTVTRSPIRLDKHNKRVLTKTLRGTVVVLEIGQP
jgi:hypothetical protein